MDVAFLGAVRDREIDAELRRCDTLILPSLNRAEAFGLVLLQALRVGVPIVTPRIAGSGVLEVNPDGRYGAEFTPGSMDALCAAVRRLRRRIAEEGETRAGCSGGARTGS